MLTYFCIHIIFCLNWYLYYNFYGKKNYVVYFIISINYLFSTWLLLSYYYLKNKKLKTVYNILDKITSFINTYPHNQIIINKMAQENFCDSSKKITNNDININVFHIFTATFNCICR